METLLEPLDQKADREIITWAKTIQKTTAGASVDLTVSDAATRSGLPLEQSEKALNWLLNDFRGRLAVGEAGDLIYRFPQGYTKPWKTRETFQELMQRLWKVALPVLKTALKIWILVVIVLYVLIFLAILVGIFFASKSRSDSSSSRRSDSGFGSFVLFRVLFELINDAAWAMFWFGPGPTRSRKIRQKPGRSERHFYDDVHSFIFGPPGPEEDPLENRKRLLAYIRAHQGRVVVGDIVALLGCSNEQAEKILTRLSIDYEGEVSVDDQGSILFSFPELRKTAGVGSDMDVSMSWDRPRSVPPLTGNKTSSNIIAIALNSFNFVMSLVSLWYHLTIKNIGYLFEGVPLSQLPDQSTALFLGVIPFLFSGLIFTIPLFRWLTRRKTVKKALYANGVRGVLQEIFGRLRFRIPAPDLSAVFQTNSQIAFMSEKQLAAGKMAAHASARSSRPRKVPDKVIAEVTLDLEGDLKINDDGSTDYAFERFEREYKSVKELRQQASQSETEPGDIVFQ
ncbi:hypothetical protein ACFL27_26105 [candidate division CSSED10-310 bacterium]|uniref:Uncharacterized protein n=1 Tax=candidate division CSSED10-310 bacterium TaxID=2855610 RepID=A0ABV6Z5G0_UNCC1